MTKASIDGPGAEQSSTPTSSPTTVAEHSPAVGIAEPSLQAPRGLGEPHPLERALEQLRDFQASIAQRVILSRVDAPIQAPVSIPIPQPAPTQLKYTAPIPSVAPSPDASPFSIPQVPTQSTLPRPATPQLATRETATHEPASSTLLKESPLIHTRTGPGEAPQKSETSIQHNKEQKAEAVSPPDKAPEKNIERKVDALPNDPVQALEKALDSILKGYTSPQAPTTQPEPHQSVMQAAHAQPIERSQSSVEQPRSMPAERPAAERAPANTSTTDQSPAVVAEQMTTRPRMIGDRAAELPRAVTLTRESPAILQAPPGKPELSLASDRPIERVERDGNLSITKTHLEQEPKQRADQSEQQRQHRTEQIQIAQQIVSTYLEQASVVRLPNQVEQAPISIQPRHESTTVAIEKIRESVLDKLTAIQSQLETTSVERKRTEHTTPSQTLSIQGRQENIKQAPIHHDVTSSLDLQYTDRSSPASQLTRLLREMAPAIAGFAAPAAVASAQGQTPTSIIGARSSLDTLNALFDLLKRFSERSNNVRLLSRMDSPLEKACLSLVTGVALGVVGVEVLIRTANVALLEMLRALRESKKHNEAREDELPLQSQLDEELEAHIQKTFIEPIKAGVVADVSGTLVEVQSAAPIAGVLIGSRELGSTISDQNGRFLFKNVPLGTGYTLTLYHPLFKLTPREVHGVCSEHAHHRIELAKTPITPKALL